MEVGKRERESERKNEVVTMEKEKVTLVFTHNPISIFNFYTPKMDQSFFGLASIEKKIFHTPIK
jgi:hypothetical protein